MSKKSITLKYQTPLEFIAFYSQKGYERERKNLEDATNKTLLDLIAIVQENKHEFYNLLETIEDFANDWGFIYCFEHDIFHEYESCPFCSLDINLR